MRAFFVAVAFASSAVVGSSASQPTRTGVEARAMTVKRVEKSLRVMAVSPAEGRYRDAAACAGAHAKPRADVGDTCPHRNTGNLLRQGPMAGVCGWIR